MRKHLLMKPSRREQLALMRFRFPTPCALAYLPDMEDDPDYRELARVMVAGIALPGLAYAIMHLIFKLT